MHSRGGALGLGPASQQPSATSDQPSELRKELSQGLQLASLLWLPAFTLLAEAGARCSKFIEKSSLCIIFALPEAAAHKLKRACQKKPGRRGSS